MADEHTDAGRMVWLRFPRLAVTLGAVTFIVGWAVLIFGTNLVWLGLPLAVGGFTSALVGRSEIRKESASRKP